MKRVHALSLVLTASFVGLLALVLFRPKPQAIKVDFSPSQSVAPIPSASESAAVLAPITIDADVDAGPSPECAALAAHNLSAVVRAEGDAGIWLPRPDVDCLTIRAGVTWGYRITNVVTTVTPDSDYGSTKITVELVRHDSAGLRAMPGTSVLLEYNESTKQNSMSLRALGDYDGDGEDEILRMHDSLAREGEPEHEASVLTFKSGKLAPYAPASAIVIDRAEDVDGDGKLDLLTSAPYERVTSASAFGSHWPVLSTSLFVAHALPDGTFSTTDSAAVAFTRRQCPSRPNIALDREHTAFANDDIVPTQIVCARLWGAPEAEIVKAWDAVCAGDASSDPYSCQSWPKNLASVTPPFTLK